LAIIEAETITGPAKNLLQFAQLGQNGKPSVEVAVATFVSDASRPNLFLDAARRAGVPAYAIPERGRFDPSTLSLLRNLTQEWRPDIVQTHAVKSHFLARLAGLHQSRPWVVFHHGYTWPEFRVRLYNELDRWSLRRADQALTVSLPFREQLVRRGLKKSRIEIVHNAIDPEWGRRCSPEQVEALRKEIGLTSETQVLLIVGRLSREKDHITLLQAFQDVLRSGPERPVHLVIVGEGPERPRIEEALRSLGLERSVFLTGHQPSVEPWYALADFSVLSSLTEGSPNALLEAMAAGVPSVATRVGGVPEIASDGETALLVEANDRRAMAGALSRLISDTALAGRLALQGRQHVLSHYSPEARMQTLCGIYGRVAELGAGKSSHRQHGDTPSSYKKNSSGPRYT
jgi:glycosyltransferase involved in cell wall biosynthesis